MKKVCNYNCFECPYEDCIAEEVPLVDVEPFLKDSPARGRSCTPENEKSRLYFRSYYEKHREEILARCKEKARQYYQSHKQERIDYQKRRYQRNREKLRAYQREYYYRKKAKEEMKP